MLHAGSYGAVGQTFSATKSGLTFSGAPGEAKPALLGRYETRATAVRWTGLLFDGPTGNVGGNGCNGEDGLLWFTSDADGGRVDHSEIRNSRGHFGVYVQADVEIDHDWIHDNGCFGEASTANLDHGIYWSSGSGEIHDNLIERSYAYGIQLYPSPNGVSVRHNTIVGSGGRGGIIVANAAANNVIANNIIAQNPTTGITTSSLTGAGNVVRKNLIYGNLEGAFGSTSGLTIIGPTIAQDPLFVSNTNFHLQPGSPATDAAEVVYATTTDLDDVLRGPGAFADLGAYELPGMTTPTCPSGVRPWRRHRRRSPCTMASTALSRCRPRGRARHARAARACRRR